MQDSLSEDSHDELDIILNLSKKRTCIEDYFEKTVQKYSISAFKDGLNFYKSHEFDINMTSGNLHKVFVYGTLKRGEPNYHTFSKNGDGYFKFLYNARTIEKFPLIIGTQYNIPFLLEKPGVGHNVQGEVFEIDDKVFANLDVLEDHPHFYVRQLHKVENLESKTSDKVWIYMIKEFNEDLLKHTFYENYSDSGSHGLKYVARYLRDPSSNIKKTFFQ